MTSTTTIDTAADPGVHKNVSVRVEFMEAFIFYPQFITRSFSLDGYKLGVKNRNCIGDQIFLSAEVFGRHSAASTIKASIMAARKRRQIS